MRWKLTDWVQTQPVIADAIGISERTYRTWRKRWPWIVREPEIRDGKPYGKPIDKTVVQSGRAAVSSEKAAIAARMPLQKAKAGRASVASQSRTDQTSGSTAATSTPEAAVEDDGEAAPITWNLVGRDGDD
jgi:hypothetical protein